MKKSSKTLTLLSFLTILSAFNLKAQLSGTIIGIGAAAGSKVFQSIGNKKKEKLIKSSLSEMQINKKKIIVLRAPVGKVESNAKAYIGSIQKELDYYYSQYSNNKHIDFQPYSTDMDMIRAVDKDWPLTYYQDELTQYKEYEMQLTQRERSIKDSIEMATRVENKRRSDSILLAVQKNRDSLEYVNRVEGYHFINKESALLKEKPSEKSQTIGKIYVGSYVEVKGYGENSPYLKIALKDIEGYLKKEDIVDDIDKISVPNANLAIYKSRRYYKYDPNYEYTPQQVVYQEPVNVVSSGAAYRVRSSSSTRSSSPARTYIRGPRGGCYYINSSGNKTYVDRSLCD